VQRARRSGQVPNKLLGSGSGKFVIKLNHEQVLDSEAADKLQLVLGGGEQSWRALRSQDADRMRIKRHDNRYAFDCLRIAQGALNNRAVPAVHTIEDANGQHDWAG
jgi:hypothetical protein